MQDEDMYKERIKHSLHETGWAIAIIEKDTDAWMNERWVIRSVKQKWGMELHLHFLKATNNADSSCCIRATNYKLRERPSDDMSIAHLLFDRFEREFPTFFAQLNAFREKFKTY